MIVPDTLVFNDASEVPNFWLRYRETGLEKVEESAFAKDEVLKAFVGESNKYHVVAVFKKHQEPVRVVRAFELEAVLNEAKLSKEPCILQKYVRPKGIYASKVKAIFTAGKRNPFASFVMTNKRSFFDVAKAEDSLSNYLVKHTDVTVMRNMNVSRRDEAFL